MPVAAFFGHPSPARPSHCALEALRGISGGETMTTPVGRAHHANLYVQHTRVRRIGFYHGVGAFSLLGSGPSLSPAPLALSPPLAGASWPIGVGRHPLSRRSPGYANYALSEILEVGFVLLRRVC
jgi:hypothetical protein